MKKLEITIDCCRKCPYCYFYYYVGVYKCNKINKTIGFEKDIESIDKDCPLDDATSVHLPSSQPISNPIE